MLYIVKKKISFLVIGVINTLVDVSIYLMLMSTSLLAPVIANFISTSIGIITSFMLNKRFTFYDSRNPRGRSFVLFFVFTAFALWVLQPIIIAAASYLVEKLDIDMPTQFQIAVPKIIATIVTLIWNYTMYDRVVFRRIDRRGSSL